MSRKSRGISEKETRRKLINRRLEHTGWDAFTLFDENREYVNELVMKCKTPNGYVDYVLFHNGKPVAIVEAKKLSIGPQNVLKQAQRYVSRYPSKWWEFGEYHVPFVYSTNGEIIWFQDLRVENSS